MEHSLLSIEALLDWISSTSEPRTASVSFDTNSVRKVWIQKLRRKWVILNCSEMLSQPDRYQLLIDAFNLPSYFGRNLSALYECLTDGDVMTSAAYVVEIRGVGMAEKLGIIEPLQGLLDTFKRVAEDLAHPCDEGMPWERGAIPFHVITKK